MENKDCNNKSKLDELRIKIDEIDEKMRELFIQRLRIVKDVALEKMANNLPVENIEREKQMIEYHLSSIEDGYKDLYQEFLQDIVKISKDYQIKLFECKDEE